MPTDELSQTILAAEAMVKHAQLTLDDATRALQSAQRSLGHHQSRIAQLIEMRDGAG